MPVNLDEIPFIPAGRGGGAYGRPKLIVLHGTASAGGIKRGMAYNVARYFGNPTTEYYAHYTNDAVDIYKSVEPTQKAPHVGNANWYAGGPSVGLELVCAATDTDNWASQDGQLTLTLAADLAFALAERYSIAWRWLTDDQLRSGLSGITDHETAARVLGGSDHTDPGRKFPRDQFMAHPVGSTPEPETPRRKPQMISLVTLNDGRLCEFYARPADGRIIHRWQPAPNEGPWSPWALLSHESGREIKLPGAFDSVSAAVNEDGRIEIVAWHSAYLAPFATFQTHNGGNWVDWYAFP